MTKRSPISAPQNIWFDAQQVDDTDLTLEQNYNNTITSGIINNHVGSGVLPEVLEQNIIFDSALSVGFLDGTIVRAQYQPTDSNFGNQLEIELNKSQVAGKKAIKICIIGLDFESNLQYETFYFRTNEIQVSHKHFTNILLILFNDFIGDPTLSLNLGGQVVIREANPFSLSRSPLMIAQDVEPNLFFRDFFLEGYLSLQALLSAALPFYNIDTLGIFTTPLDNHVLLNGDVTTQIGQKFIASTNNIQKINLLLSVRNTEVGNEDDLVWNGDLVISIYPLQSTIECASDIAPNLPIDFSPSNIPVAQLSVNYNTLQSSGTILNTVPQPVDFIFSNSSVASGNVLTVGSYYAVTIKRSGSANKCDILIAVGSDRVPDSRITTFTGTLWVDIPDQDLWFRVWTDAAKISDGQIYETGHGVVLPKTSQDPNTLTTIDYSLEDLQFTGNGVFRAVVAASIEENTPIPDQRTGNPVLSRQEFVPSIKLLNTIDITNLEKASEPLIIGAISDKNIKFFDSISSIINSNLYSATMVHDELIIKIVDDSTDVVRFDSSVSGLVTNLLNGDFVGAQIFPHASNTNNYFRIASAKLASCILGDVDGNGIIDVNDLNILNTYLNYDLNTGLPTDTILVTDGITTTFTNGYNTYTKPFSSAFGINFQLVDPDTGAVLESANDGVLVANPNDNRLAQFTSASVSFNTIIGLGSFKLILLLPSNQENYGGFDIISVDSLTDVLTLRKVFLTGDVLMQMLRADIDGDFHITYTDGYLLQNYIDRNVLTNSPTSTYPGPSTNPFTKIGTRFNVIRFKLEEFIDRADDYSSVTVDRTTVVHLAPDIFLSDGYFADHDFYLSPVVWSIQKQLTWDESLIVTNSKPRGVPTVFTSLSGFQNNSCHIDGVSISVYESGPDFDQGRVDIFVPNNLIIGRGGELHRPDGNFYKVDFEVGTIVLEIPDGLFGSERTINILDDFISDYTGDGRTRLGFPAMKFADCSLVTNDALTNDQLRFSVAVQSFSPNTNGLSVDGYDGAIVDGKIGVSIDYNTGLLTLNFTNLYQDAVLQTLSTKIQINVFLKKGGFNNQTLFIDSGKMQNMLKLISVFSGAVDGGPSALVDLQNDITGVLPIIHGGTGLNDVGAFGTVLTSNGSGLSYQFIFDMVGVIPFSTGIPDADRVPKTDGYGLLDPSFMYKNPMYIYTSSGRDATVGSTEINFGACTFRFDKYILEGLESITFEAILKSSTAGEKAQVRLLNVSNSGYLPLVGVSTYLSTTNDTITYVVSDDLKEQFLSGADDYIYAMYLSGETVSTEATCYMSRLVMTYNNPVGAAPPTAHSSNFVPYLPSPTPI
jgi:hypothetical protein